MARYFAPDGITLKHAIVFLISQESHRDGLVGVLSAESYFLSIGEKFQY